MDAIFQRIVNNSFSDLPGLRLDASIPVPEWLVNEILESALAGDKNIEYCRVSIGGQNRVSVNIKTPLWPWPFMLKLRLFQAVDLAGSPKVRAFLENLVLLGKLGAVFKALPKEVTLYEDQVSVDVGAYIQNPDQKRLLGLVRSAEIRTEPGRFIIDLKAGVDEQL
jgi:hypothetical protein